MLLLEGYFIVLAGFCTGITGGFFGINGSLLLTPLLGAMGFPMASAVGTNLSHLFGRSALTALKNRAAPHINWKLGTITGLTGAGGVFLGRRLVLFLEETGPAGSALKILYMAFLLAAGAFMLWENFRCRKPESRLHIYTRISAFAGKIRGAGILPMVYLPEYGDKSISLWLLAAIGTAAGLLSGVLGISGSFLRLPALVFLAGLPLLPALCTDVLATMISAGIGAAGFAACGRVEILAAALLLLGSWTGSQIGRAAARNVNREGLKLILPANLAAVLAGLALNCLGHGTLAAALMLGSTAAAGMVPVLAIGQAALREARAEPGLPVAKKSVQAPGEAPNHVA
ncbi:MAG: sulfite exporter TauE/SafE family protein [Peptococcaceae bacterium]|nr:sulfite exporter TauE/SafE family protein [Peptococcaceae bacterium]